MDQTLFHLINEQWTNPVLDLLMAALSDVGIWKPFLIILILAALIFGGFRARACILCLFISLLITEQVTNVLKSAIDRRRPKQVEPVRMVLLQKATPKFLTLFKPLIVQKTNRAEPSRNGMSFPSGHVTNNTTIAVCLTLFYRRRGWLYWILTGAIGYSRIYLGAHWPSDVIATLFLATGETLLILAALEWIWRRAAPNWLPQLYERHPGLIVDLAR